MSPRAQKAHQRYYDASGEMLPGVTTVIGQLDKPALFIWANREGLKGNDVTATRSTAQNVGTLVHLMIQHIVQGTEPDLDEFSAADIREALHAVNAFRAWKADHRVEFIASELELVSETWKYGGTIDFIAKVNGVLTLIDFKTSSNIYDEHIYQVAAYAALARENKHPIERVMILQVSTVPGQGYTPKVMGDLTAHFAGFTHLLAFYRIKKYIAQETKKRPKQALPASTAQAVIAVAPRTDIATGDTPEPTESEHHDAEGTPVRQPIPSGQAG